MSNHFFVDQPNVPANRVLANGVLPYGTRNDDRTHQSQVRCRMTIGSRDRRTKNHPWHGLSSRNRRSARLALLCSRDWIAFSSIVPPHLRKRKDEARLGSPTAPKRWLRPTPTTPGGTSPAAPAPWPPPTPGTTPAATPTQPPDTSNSAPATTTQPATPPTTPTPLGCSAHVRALPSRASFMASARW